MQRVFEASKGAAVLVISLDHFSGSEKVKAAPIK